MIRVSFRDLVLCQDARDTGRMSFAFFCPCCGEVWGRVERARSAWYCIERLCDRHDEQRGSVGGSFFQLYDWWPGVEFGAGEPGLRKFLLEHPALRAHEFQVAMAWADKVYPPQAEACTT